MKKGISVTIPPPFCKRGQSSLGARRGGYNLRGPKAMQKCNKTNKLFQRKRFKSKFSLSFGLHLVLSFCLGTALEFIRVFPDLPQDDLKATTFTLVSVSQLQTMYVIIGTKR